MTLPPIVSYEDVRREAVWVDAAPFRAHLGQLLAAGLPEPVIARLTGVSLRGVQHLAHGRRGRAVRRVCPEVGCRLLTITVAEARALRYRPVAVRPSRYRLRTMTAAGWTLAELAESLELSVRELDELMTRGSRTCAELTALKIAVGYQRWVLSPRDSFQILAA